MSNNSMFLEEKPSKEELRKLMLSIKETVKSGFVNVKAAKERRPDSFQLLSTHAVKLC